MNEMQRILALPVDTRTGDELVDEYTERLGVPGGEWEMHPHQALALHYVEELGGGFFPLDVGAGKTFIGMAAPRILGVDDEDVVVLCPAGLRDEAAELHAETSEHFDVAFPRYVSYSELSRNLELLEDAAPKLIIADEAHRLRNKKAARTRRFLDYMRRHPETGFVAMTGTIANRSIFEYAHLIQLALKDASPLPSSYSRLSRWSRILDVNSPNHPDSYDWAKFGELIDAFFPDDAECANTMRAKARFAYQCRLVSAFGVVVTEGSSCDAPIEIRCIDDVETPKSIRAALVRADEYWELPGDEEIRDPLQKSAKLRQLSQGFYYYFDWPEGKPNFPWLEARSRANRALREINRRRYKGIDTDMLAVRAIEAGRLPEFEEPWAAWRAWDHYDPPPRKPRWMSDYLLDDAVARATPGTLIWYAHREVGERLATRIPTAMAGEAVPKSEPVVGVSIRSHGTGLNLQYDFHRHLILCSPSNGGLLHQLIGRIHRHGFEGDKVLVDFYTHTAALKAAVEQAREDARGQFEREGVENKLHIGVWE